MTATVLILAANPEQTTRLRLEAEMRDIRSALERSRYGRDIQVATRGAVRRQDVLRSVLDLKPTIVHFCGHGSDRTGQNGLVFENDDGQPNYVDTATLEEFFEIFSPDVRCVVLNACYSENQAEAVARHIDFVVGMDGAVEDRAALAYAVAFYDALGAGRNLGEAHTIACNAIRWTQQEGRLIPRLHVRKGAKLELFHPQADSESTESSVPASRQAGEHSRQTVEQFGVYLEDKLRDFVGREWLFAKIERFLGEHERGYFLLTGDPGIGKSALLARMTKPQDWLASFNLAYHFNLRAQRIDSPELFHNSICAQLSASYNLPPPMALAESSRTAIHLTEVLQAVSRKIVAGQAPKALILVDALDEADTSITASANVLFLPMTLPRGVYVVATSRRGGPPLHVECEIDRHHLDQDSDEQMKDVRSLVEKWKERPGIERYIGEQEMDAEAFVDLMVRRSQGNFMYLRHVLPQIDRGFYCDQSFEKLPYGLENYYQDHWARLRRRDEIAWIRFDLKILAVLAAARNAFSTTQIAEYAGIEDVSRVRVTLSSWRAFTYSTAGPEGETQHRLYHESFRDFVAAHEEIDIRGAHSNIGLAMAAKLYGDEGHGSHE